MQKLANLELFERLTTNSNVGLSVFNDETLVLDETVDGEPVAQEGWFGRMLRSAGDAWAAHRDRKQWASDISRDIMAIGSDINKLADDLLEEIPEFSLSSEDIIFDKIKQLIEYSYGDFESVDHFNSKDHAKVAKIRSDAMGNVADIIGDRLKRVKGYTKALKQARKALLTGSLNELGNQFRATFIG